MKLYPHQEKELNETRHLNRVAYYHDMGLGKTYTGAEKAMRLGAKTILIVCQKSKIDDWVNHFYENYKDPDKPYELYVWNLTNKRHMDGFISIHSNTQGCECKNVGVINYDLVFRRPILKEISCFTLILDESSMIQNENAKRSKFILSMKPANVILLSGTPTAGKYEKLWSQLKLLGWKISKDLYWKQFVDVDYLDQLGYPIRVVKGYKNVERLKKKLREYGARFLKTEEVFDLPLQTFSDIKVATTKEYRHFRKNCIVEFDGIELVGETSLTKMLYERMLCGHLNKEKLSAFTDLLDGTNDRLIVFYNFKAELEAMLKIVEDYDRPISVVNGDTKDLSNYEEYDNSITFIQYQAGAMGLNLQKANKIIYFTPPLSSELFEQSKKRIHRIGQDKPCFYYQLVCRNSVEEKIYSTLAMRKDYTDKLFKQDDEVNSIW